MIERLISINIIAFNLLETKIKKIYSDQTKKSTVKRKDGNKIK